MKPLRPHPITIVLYGVALLLAAAIFGAAHLISSQVKDGVIASTQGQASRFVSGSAASLNRSLLGIDLLLSDLGALLRTASRDTLATEAKDPRIVQLMTVSASHNLLVGYVAFLTPTGEVLASSDRRGMQLAVKLPPGFIDEVLAQPLPTLAASLPSTSAISSQRVVYFARAITLADGTRFIATAEVKVSLLTSLLTQGADIKGLEVTLEKDAGPMLASVPPRDDLAGTVLVPPISESRSDGGASLSKARLDGQPAILAAQPTLHRNLLIVGSINLDTALQEWRTQRSFILMMASIFMLTIFIVAALIHTHLRRQWRTEAMLDRALESMSDGFVLLDDTGRVLTWNRRFTEMFPSSTAIIRPGLPFGHLDVAAALDTQADTISHVTTYGSKLPPGERELTLPDGQAVLSVQTNTADGGLMCVFRDVTEKRRYVADILEGKAQVQATLEALPDVMMEIDLDGICHRFHFPAGHEPFFDTVDAIDPVGRSVRDFLPTEAAAELMLAVQESMVAGVSKGRQFERRAPTGTRWYEMSVSRKSSALREAHFILILRDITERKSAARQIEDLAFYDGLTGLPNRKLLLHRLALVAKDNARRNQHAALLFLDLDNFKTINDAHGQTMGDSLLKLVALRLLSVMSEGDMVARLGGDEFVVVLENLGEEALEAKARTQLVAQALLSELQPPFELEELVYHSTCSIGATILAGPEQSVETLLKQADIAMYHAKTAGGKSVRFFEPAMQNVITARATLQNELHAALTSGEFFLQYQRQVDVEGKTTGAEVLIRWNHPQRGLVPPAGFIDLAEDTGLIVPIGLWVLRQACMQLKQWSLDPARAHLHVAVNVSARQFRNDDFVDEVRAILADTGADASKLKLELTESLLQEKVVETISKMNALAAIGIQFSMDDFGTGFSSLSYMTRLPLDQVKIDRSFVSSIGKNPKAELIIQTIIAMAQGLELSVVAEGVETQEQLEFLRKHGCKLFQGYLFGKPMGLDDFEAQADAAMPAVQDTASRIAQLRATGSLVGSPSIDAADRIALLEDTLDRMGQGIMMVNGDRVVEVCNQRAMELLDLPRELMLSRPTFEEVLAHQWSKDEFAQTPEELKKFVRSGGILDRAHSYDRRRPDGRVIEIQSVPIEGGGVIRTYVDITERRNAEERVKFLATHDGLTSLTNRDVFLEALHEATSQCERTGEIFAVYFIDLDKFKLINDRHGHAIGDKVLVQAANRMRGLVDAAVDVVARLGGDEFAILKRKIDGSDQAMAFAQDLLKAFEPPMHIEHRLLELKASVGVALYPSSSNDADLLLRTADSAMYLAKASGNGLARMFYEGTEIASTTLVL